MLACLGKVDSNRNHGNRSSMLRRLDVDVHKVSAIKLSKKKHLVWMLGTGFCSSWLWDSSHCRFLFSSLRLSWPRRSLIQGVSPAGPVFSEGTELAPSAGRGYALPWPLKCFPSSRSRPAAGGPLLRSEPAGDFIKVAGWAFGEMSCPSWM